MTAAVSETQTPNTPSAGQQSHLARTQALAARDDDPTPAPQAAAEGEPDANAEAAPPVDADKTGETSEAASDAEAGTEAETPAVADPKADRMAARFAALAREKKADLDRKAQIAAEGRAAHERAQYLESQHTARAAELDKREARMREAEERDHKLLADTPELVFKRLQDLGVDSEEKLRAVAKGVWGAERPKPVVEAQKTPDDPRKRPMTVEEFEEREKQSLAKAKYERAVADYDAGFSEEKHEAASLLFDRDKRVSLGNQIAQRLADAGKPVDFDDVREAVNTLAEQDARWQSILKKRAPQSVSATNGKSATTVAPKDVASSSPPKSPRAASPNTDAAAPPAQNGERPAETRKQRLARLMSG